MYYMTAFDGAPILNNNRLTVSVREMKLPEYARMALT